MKKRCTYCNAKNHNVATCIWANIQIGDSVNKSKLIERFGHLNHKKWKINKFVNVPIKDKLLDNKYKLIEIIEGKNSWRYVLDSKRNVVKWSETIAKKERKTLPSITILLKDSVKFK